MFKITFILIASAFLLFSENIKDNFVKAQNSPLLKDSNSTNKGTKLSISEATIKAINEIRGKKQICSNAVKDLKWNQNLYEIAKEHSLDMAKHHLLQHDGSGLDSDITAKKLGLNRGSKFYERVNQEKDSKAKLSAELITRTDTYYHRSPKDLIKLWIQQPQYCKILMDPRFSDVAMAQVVNNAENKAYWTLLLMGDRK